MAAEIINNEGKVAGLSVVASTDYLQDVTSLVKSVSTKLGLDNKAALELELMVEEAALNVINYGFDPDETGEYEVILMRRPGKVVVAIEDRGLPLDISKLAADNETGMGIMIMKSLADEISFQNLGPGGKRVEMTKNLHYDDAEKFATETDRSPMAEKAPEDEELTYRMMSSGEVVDLARCVYRSYGYSYLLDTIYYPEKVRELIESGYLVSIVAANPSGEVVGHLAIMLDLPGAKVGETGQAVTDPRYRGRGIFSKLKKMAIEAARERGMFGIFAFAITAHEYTQKGNVKIGAHETAFLPLMLPERVAIKSIADGESGHRRGVVVYYLPIDRGVERTVYPPFHHKTMLKKIYERLGLPRILCGARDTKHTEPDESNSTVIVMMKPSSGQAFIKVDNYGKDFKQLIALRLRELCLKKMSAICLDLPLDNPLTQRYCAEMEKMGFFFTGIIPEFSLAGGDVLRLMFVNNVDILSDSPHIYTDFARELYDYMLKSSRR